jgi:hypothetical protein
MPPLERRKPGPRESAGFDPDIRLNIRLTLSDARGPVPELNPYLDVCCAGRWWRLASVPVPETSDGPWAIGVLLEERLAPDTAYL